MILPFAAGTVIALILAAAVGDRRLFQWILIAAFATGALAAAGVSLANYAALTAALTAAIAIYVIAVEERVIERALTWLAAVALVVASNNAAFAEALGIIMYHIIKQIFIAVANLAAPAFGAAASAVISLPLLFALIAVYPRLIRAAEENPLAGIGAVLAAYSIIAPAVAAVPDYLRLALAIALLWPLGRAIRGNMEALEEVAPASFLLKDILPADAVVTIFTLITMIEIVMAVFAGKRRLAAAALWATAALVFAAPPV